MREKLLSDEQIASFKAEAPGSKEGEKFVFNASFGPQTLSAADKRKFSRSGEVPYRITVGYDERRTVKDRVVSRTASGRINFYVLDAEGNIVAMDAMTSEKMCPT